MLRMLALLRSEDDIQHCGSGAMHTIGRGNQVVVAGRVAKRRGVTVCVALLALILSYLRSRRL